jgi:hypothetical protein
MTQAFFWLGVAGLACMWLIVFALNDIVKAIRKSKP